MGRQDKMQMANHLIDKWSETVFVDDENISLMDKKFKSALSRAFSGMSPIEVCLAYLDWLSHLAISPGKQLQLVQSLISNALKLGFTTSARCSDNHLTALRQNWREGSAVTTGSAGHLMFWHRLTKPPGTGGMKRPVMLRAAAIVTWNW